jgi:hypothetical protein
VTREHVHFDLGTLGVVDVEVQPSEHLETVRPACAEPTTTEGLAYMGTIAFHGEEGFTDAEATRLPLRFQPLFDLLCGVPTGGSTELGRGSAAVEMNAESKGGPRLTLDQNHPGVRVEYEAKVREVEGAVKVVRTVSGHLPARVLRHSPSLESASFAPGSPFSGRATYKGKSLPREARPGRGTWRGSLKVDFPGRADVRLAGPSFSASIIPAEHHGFSE